MAVILCYLGSLENCMCALGMGERGGEGECTKVCLRRIGERKREENAWQATHCGLAKNTYYSIGIKIIEHLSYVYIIISIFYLLLI